MSGSASVEYRCTIVSGVALSCVVVNQTWNDRFFGSADHTPQIS